MSGKQNRNFHQYFYKVLKITNFIKRVPPLPSYFLSAQWLCLVQGTYKKWISLKRKFRVEFFKSKSEDANSREASCTFPYFEALKFLIPYCEVYKL